MDSKSGLRSVEDREARLKFSLLAALVWVFLSICVDFIIRALMRPLRDTCAFKELRSDSINAAKFYLILRSLNLKFSPQNLIVPKF